MAIPFQARRARVIPLWKEQRTVLGNDPWPYGLERNRHVVSTLMSYLYEQGLAKEKIEVDNFLLLTRWIFSRLLKKTQWFVALARLAPTYRKEYASACRFFARLASEIFLSGLQIRVFSSWLDSCYRWQYWRS